MTVLSLLRATAGAAVSPSSFVNQCLRNGIKNNVQLVVKNGKQQSRALTTSVVRCGGGGDRTMVILPSKFQWHKYKDQFHFYLFLGLIPALSIVFYCNVFIGPGKLSEIPCGYEPKHWEYYSHPITRFMARYLIISLQENYERNLHYIMEMDEERRLRRLQKKIDNLMAERGDYPNFYVSKPLDGKYMRFRAIEDREVGSQVGDN